MIFGVALEALRKQSNCWDKITECSAKCEECECHVDASDLVEAVKTVLDNFPTQMSGTSESRGGGKMSINEAVEALRKYYGCRTTTGCGSLGDLCDRCEYDVDADTVTEALKTVLDTFGICSVLLTSQTKFKPGSKFLLEIGEKRIGLDEYSIVGTDLYVWGSLLEKLTPYEAVQAEQKITHCENCKHRHLENDVWTCPFGLPGGPRFFCGYGSDANE